MYASVAGTLAGIAVQVQLNITTVGVQHQTGAPKMSISASSISAVNLGSVVSKMWASCPSEATSILSQVQIPQLSASYNTTAKRLVVSANASNLNVPTLSEYGYAFSYAGTHYSFATDPFYLRVHTSITMAALRAENMAAYLEITKEQGAVLQVAVQS
jgi:tripartite-type tricarboxylate transporter receptor subunit TctC